MTKLLFLLAIALAMLTHANAQTSQIKPKGVYKAIDVEKHNAAIEILAGENQQLKKQTVETILKAPNSFNPPVIYALSKELFNRDKKHEAVFWFYVAQLRARYDANLCLDTSAKQAVSMLNSTYGPAINEYAMKNIDFLEKTINQVVAFVRENEETYDHRWINLHGLGALLNRKVKEITEPAEKWAKIKESTVDNYHRDFVEYVVKPKKNRI